RIRSRFGAVHALGFGIASNEGDLRGRPSRIREILESIVIDGKEAAGCAIFRGHVADGRSIGNREMSESRTEKFDELADNTALAQHLGDGEHEVRCRNAFLELARELYANDFRQQHGIWLPEHGRLGLDAANAPAEHGEAVDPSGVGIGTTDRLWLSHFAGR